MNLEHPSLEHAEALDPDYEHVRTFVEASGLPYGNVPAIVDRLVRLYRAGKSEDALNIEGVEHVGKEGTVNIHSHFEDELEMAHFARQIREQLEASGASPEELETWGAMEHILFLQDLGKAGFPGVTEAAKQSPDAAALLYAIETISDNPLTATIADVIEHDLAIPQGDKPGLKRSILAYLKQAEERYVSVVTTPKAGERPAILRNAPEESVWGSFSKATIDDLSDDQVNDIIRETRMRLFWDAHSVHSEKILAENRDACVSALREKEGIVKEEAETLFEHVREGVGSHHHIEGISVIDDNDLVNNHAAVRSACIDKIHAHLKRSHVAFEKPSEEAWESACRDTENRIRYAFGESGDLYEAHMREVEYLRTHSEIGSLLVEHVRASRQGH